MRETLAAPIVRISVSGERKEEESGDVRVLVVLTQPPLPEGGAPGKVALGLLRGLMAHGLEVHALAARQRFALAGEVPPDLPVEVVEVESPSRWAGRLGRFRRPRGELARGLFASRVREAAQEADILHLEETETGWLSSGVNVPSVVHLHYLVRRDRDLGPPWDRRFREVLEFSLAERAAIRRHRYLVASSPLVAEDLLRRAPHAEVALAPLSLDPANYMPAPLDGAPTAGIVGTAAWPTSAAAMRELVELVWPLVRRRVPEARLVVAGRGTATLGLSGDGVEVLGEVESASALMQSLSVLLFPLRRGSGMKVKVLESIASGVPVVTTPLGAEGIGGGDGIVVRAEPAELAAEAAELLLDPQARRERGAAARAAFDARFRPEPATEPLMHLYERMVRKPGSRR